jgi:hypothetical protein
MVASLRRSVVAVELEAAESAAELPWVWRRDGLRRRRHGLAVRSLQVALQRPDAPLQLAGSPEGKEGRKGRGQRRQREQHDEHRHASPLRREGG